MKTRVLFLMLLSGVVVSLSSCTHTEKRVVPGTESAFYLIKSANGQKSWGLELSGEMVVECEYDSIARQGGPAYYKALKNGLWYAFSRRGEKIESVPAFTEFKDISLSNPVSGGPGWILYTPQGVYGCYPGRLSEYPCFGPYEDFFSGARGFFFKGNSGWGYQDYDADKKEAKPLLPAEYEEIIEVSGGKVKNGYFLVKKNGKWSFFDKRREKPYVAGFDLFFDGNFQPLNISIENLLKWYGRFPNGEKSELNISHKNVECTKHLSGAVGVMRDVL